MRKELVTRALGASANDCSATPTEPKTEEPAWIAKKLFRNLLLIGCVSILATACDDLAGTDDDEEQSLSDHPLCCSTWSTSQGTTVRFGSDGSGRLFFPDLNNTGVCSSGSVSLFDWTASSFSSSGSVTLDYQSVTICGESQSPPSNDTSSYSVSGGSLTYAGTTWTR